MEDGLASQCHTAPLWPPFWQIRGSDLPFTESWRVKEFIFSLVRGVDGVARWLAQSEGAWVRLVPLPLGGTVNLVGGPELGYMGNPCRGLDFFLRRAGVGQARRHQHKPTYCSFDWAPPLPDDVCVSVCVCVPVFCVCVSDCNWLGGGRGWVCWLMGWYMHVGRGVY